MMFSSLQAQTTKISFQIFTSWLLAGHSLLCCRPLNMSLKQPENKHALRNINITIIVTCLWKMHLMLHDFQYDKSLHPALAGFSNSAHHELGKSCNTVENQLGWCFTIISSVILCKMLYYGMRRSTVSLKESEELPSSSSAVSLCQASQRHIPEISTVHGPSCDNLKPHSSVCC
jgi:hypothetical protein